MESSQWRSMWWLGLLGGWVVAIDPVLAQVIPDSTLGSESSVIQKLNELSDRIDGGATRGANLFHSFQEFNVGEGRGVYFANPAGIQNILSRVTGGNASLIFGKLGVLGKANLFLINPNGILFGPNSSLDIQGSFFATTADGIKLGENGFFSATEPGNSNLLSVSPGASFFAQVTNQRGSIINRGNLAVGGDLTLSAGILDLQGQLQAGGNLTLQAIDTVQISDSLENPFIVAARGNVLVQGDRNVDIFALNHPASGLFSGGDMILRSANTVGGDAHFWSGGSFRIERLDGSFGDLYSPNDPVIRSFGDVSIGAYEGASLHIIAGGKVEIPNGIIITSSDPVNGLVENISLSNGQTIAINGRTEPTVDIRAGVRPEAIGSPLGLIGLGSFFPPFFIAPPTSADIKIGTIAFIRDVAGTPLAGNLLLTNQYQPNLALNGGIQISATQGEVLAGVASRTGDVNSGGLVTFDSRGGIAINGFIRSSAAPVGVLPSGIPIYQGNGGDVTLLARGNINFPSQSGILADGILGGRIRLESQANISATNSLIRSLSFSPIANAKGNTLNIMSRSFSLTGTQLSTSSFGESSAGDIKINVETLDILNRTQILSNPSGQGRGGDITITASESIKLIKNPFDTNSITGLTPTTVGIGDGGNIDITTRNLSVQNGARISTTTFGQGKGGDITVNADSVELIGTTFADVPFPSLLSALSQGNGDAGNITINTRTLAIQNGAIISTATTGNGRGGNLLIAASDSLEISGTSFNNRARSAVTAGTIGNGDSGEVRINTGRLTLQGGGNIITDAGIGSQGQGGNITVVADSLEVIGTTSDGLQGSAISSQTEGLGDSGTININTRNLSLRDGGQVSSSSLGEGSGNTLTINAIGSIDVNDVSTIGRVIQSGIITEAIGTGSAGNLNITSSQLTVQNGGIISSRTFFAGGDAGNITVNSSGSVELFGRSPDGTIGSGLVSGTSGAGRAGDIQMTAGRLSVRDGAVVSSTTFGTGLGGNLTVNADSIAIEGKAPNGRFASGLFTATFDRGNGGNLAITTTDLRVDDGGEIATSTVGQGNAGAMAIGATDFISLTQGGTLRADTAGQGNAGAITIDSPNAAIALDGFKTSNVLSPSGTIVSTTTTPSSIISLVQSVDGLTSDRRGGDISITAKSLSLTNFAQLNALTAGQGNAGNIFVNTIDAISLDNNGLIVSTAEPGGIGNAGTIDIKAESLTLNNNSQIVTNTFREGNAGNISIEVDDAIALTNRSGILSSVGLGGLGLGGDIDIQSRSLSVTDGSQVQTLLFRAENGRAGGQGKAGNIVVDITDFVNLAGVSLDGFSSGLFASTEKGANGDGGNITVTTNAFRVADGAIVNAFTANSGNAQNIIINAQTFAATGGGQVIASTRGSGNAGNITLNITDTISLAGSDPTFVDRLARFGEDIVNNQGAESGIFAQTQGQGIAGNIFINAPTFNIADNAIISARTSNAGDGGNITINTPNSVTLGNNSRLTVETSGAGQAGNITLTTDTLNIGKDAELSATATETATNPQGGGSITLNTSTLNISGKLGIFAETRGFSPAGTLTLQPNNNNPNLNIRFTDNGFISASTTSAGEGGNINLNAPQTIDIRGQGRIAVTTSGSGNAGAIDIFTQNLTLADGLEISASTTGQGDAGNINFNATNLSLSRTQINAFTDGIGNAGSIVLSNRGNNASQISLNDNSTISTEIRANGQATRPSNIEIRTDNLTLDNSRVTSSTEGKGDAGNITVLNGKNITLNRSEISASTSGEGDTGVINLNATGNLNLNDSQINSSVEQGAVGNSQQITLNTPSLTLNNSQVNATTAGQGNAGSIVVEDAEMVRLDNSTISTAIAPEGIATQPSNITLNTRQLTLDNNSRVTASTEGKGDAGNITVPDAQNITLNNSQISASTSGEGDAGDISIQTHTLTLNDRSAITTTVNEGAIGQGGNITLETTGNSLTLNNQSQISSRSQGQGNAGNITINSAGNVTLINSDITTAAEQASGGAITINGENIRLYGDSDIRTNVNSGVGGGGNITLTADSILIYDDSDILAFARDGQGGNITFRTAIFFGDGFQSTSDKTSPDNLDNNGRVDINASGAISGTISLPDLNFIRNSLAELPQNLVDIDRLIANSCVVPNRRQMGTFVITGSGGLPTRPGDASMSSYPTGTVRTVPDKPSSRSWQPGDPIIEPQGVYRLPDGRLVFSRECR